jgi:hypothetical protein
MADVPKLVFVFPQEENNFSQSNLWHDALS